MAAVYVHSPRGPPPALDSSPCASTTQRGHSCSARNLRTSDTQLYSSAPTTPDQEAEKIMDDANKLRDTISDACSKKVLPPALVGACLRTFF